MKMLKYLMATLVFVAVGAQGAATPTDLTCDDLRERLEPTPEALARFSELEGSCEGVVERNGALYMITTAVVRRAGNRTVTLYLPSTDHTFDVSPRRNSRVLLDGNKVRPRDLSRGQQIQIYLSVDEFTQPRIDEIAMATPNDDIVSHPMEPTSALPTTASPLPTFALFGLLLLGAGFVIRRLRVARSKLRYASSLAALQK